MATRTDTQAAALPAADSHDMIRVTGARVNNLKDISLEIPKRRLTVFTGVSGSGKSSLVFGTVAAESQRLINETYSAFVQGFMPTLARPDVDVLDGLTTAILVDQQPMGADPRSTVGTATDVVGGLLHGGTGGGHLGQLRLDVRHVPVGHRRGHALLRAVRHQPDVLALGVVADVVGRVVLRLGAEQGGVHRLGRLQVGHRMQHGLDALGGRVAHGPS